MDSRTQPMKWPNGARVAVMATVMYEAWPEGKGPPYGPMASALREGTLDLQSVSWANYGGRTGIWRLLRLFKAFDIRATICGMLCGPSRRQARICRSRSRRWSI